MADYPLTEQDYRIAIRTGYAMNAHAEVLDSMTRLAYLLHKLGHNQEAADLLAYVLIQVDTPADTYDRAEDLMMSLEASICPRVVYDAKAFAYDTTLEDMMDYLFTEDPAD